jgi:hypothetical protein
MKLQREDIHPLQDTCPYFTIGIPRPFVGLERSQTFQLRREGL